MKALILWARDHHPDPYKLRIENRTESEVVGTVLIEGAWLQFGYKRADHIIVLEKDGDMQEIVINEWGWEQ